MTTSNWRERFDEEFLRPNGMWKDSYVYRDGGQIHSAAILAFIEKEIEAAKQEERDAIVEVVEGMKLNVMKGGCGIKTHTHHNPENWTYNRALKDVAAHLQTSNKNN